MQIDVETHAAIVAARMRARAEAGIVSGRVEDYSGPYFLSCVRDDDVTGARIIFTRDTGHHTSGWLRNPDYERCFHLSLSSWDAAAGEPLGRLAPEVVRLWPRAFFREDLRLAWIEGAASRAGRKLAVRHWRVFCDEHWSPIHPRGEVYSSELTERGWRSASQVTEEDGVVIESILRP